jgi:pyruvate, orthophosphate dikinase
VTLARELVAEVQSGSLSREEALRKLPASFLSAAELALDLDPSSPKTYRGVPAGPGAASGQLTFNAPHALALAREGKAVVLAVEETSAEDIEAMTAARGIIAVRGGLTGHAAIVSRGLGKPCLCGGSGMSFVRDEASGARGLKVELASGTLTLQVGDLVSFDGSSALLVVGPARLVTLGPEVDEILGWATVPGLAQLDPTGEPPSVAIDRARRALRAI